MMCVNGGGGSCLTGSVVVKKELASQGWHLTNLKSCEKIVCP